jgi:hypothetical protein
MLTCNAAKALKALEYDIGDLATVQAWTNLQHLAEASLRTQKQVGPGKWVAATVEERLLHMRNVMLMELTGKVSDDEEIWRVVVNELGVKALYIGLGSQAPIEVQTLSGLPQWMQARVAVLSMLTESPPTKPIEGVGRRITDTVYWIVK